MGMYTQLTFNARIQMPDREMSMLKLLIAGDPPEPSPDLHQFFQSERPWLLNSGGSEYFAGVVKPTLTPCEHDTTGTNFLHFVVDIKNYDNEIEKFLDWIKPYVTQGAGARELYATVIYEEAEEPTHYYLEGPSDA